MSRVSYFQRYSQRENHVTNNTLLVFQYLYRSSPLRFQEFLCGLVENDLSVGINFDQQITEAESVPDALISQASFDVYIETKRAAVLDEDQIKRHIDSISSSTKIESQKILLGLTTQHIGDVLNAKFTDRAKSKGISFSNISFHEIVDGLRTSCPVHEDDLLAVIADYEEYLLGEGLLKSGQTILSIPCGTSLNENWEFKLYFHPVKYPTIANDDFIGFYKDKKVQFVGQPETIITGIMDDEEFQVITTERGEFSDLHKQHIHAAINACTYFPNFANEEHTYYLFDELYKTDFRKTSKGGQFGRKRFELSEWINYPQAGYEFSAQKIATELCGKAYE